MSAVLSSVSGVFNRAFFFGTLLPTVIFMVLNAVFVPPLLPRGLNLPPLPAVSDIPAELIALPFIAIVISGVLHNTNVQIEQMYGGTIWKNWQIGQWKINRQRKLFESIRSRTVVHRNLLMYLDRSDEKFNIIREVYRKNFQSMSIDYPNHSNQIMPTRLGNIIESFRSYPAEQYGISWEVIGPRMSFRSDANYTAQLQESKAAFDFMMNSSLLYLVLVGEIVLAGILWFVPMSSVSLLLWWLLEIAVFCLIAYGCYLASFKPARMWGETFKGTFDLYRLDLLKQLGYNTVPGNRDEERALWRRISAQMALGDGPEGPRAEYSRAKPSDVAPSATQVKSSSSLEDLEITRGVHRSRADLYTTIHIRVRHKRPDGAAAENVEIVESLPVGDDYVWSSAQIPDGTVEVSGMNPYHFSVGTIAAGRDVTLTYGVLRGTSHDA